MLYKSVLFFFKVQYEGFQKQKTGFFLAGWGQVSHTKNQSQIINKVGPGVLKQPVFCFLRRFQYVNMCEKQIDHAMV